MLRVCIRRLLFTIPLLLIITIGAFALQVAIPGDPAQALAGDQATPEQLAAVRADLHLDLPGPVRYLYWLGDALHGNLGVSVATHRSVSEEIARRFPVDAELALCALLMALAVGIPLGIAQGTRPGSRLDKLLLLMVSLGLSTPGFFLATIFIYVFAVQLRVLPALGHPNFGDSPGQWALHMILPVVTLAIAEAASIARQLRTGLVGVMQEDYIRSARARGLSPLRVNGKHALKNASMSTLTVVGLRLGGILAGAVIIEQIFQFPGLGTYTLMAIQRHDYPVLQGAVLSVAVIVVTVNLLTDIAYGWLNPKVRLA
jgi:peptide/nickel transport system permease protein